MVPQHKIALLLPILLGLSSCKDASHQRPAQKSSGPAVACTATAPAPLPPFSNLGIESFFQLLNEVARDTNESQEQRANTIRLFEDAWGEPVVRVNPEFAKRLGRYYAEYRAVAARFIHDHNIGDRWIVICLTRALETQDQPSTFKLDDYVTILREINEQEKLAVQAKLTKAQLADVQQEIDETIDKLQAYEVTQINRLHENVLLPAFKCHPDSKLRAKLLKLRFRPA